MATADEVTTSEPSDHDCSICSELFTDPKLLPCCHLLCRRCLIDLLESKPRAQCPLCRCPIVDPGKAGPKNSCDVIADGFPTDLAMVELIEADRLLTKDHVCCVCEDVAATSFCLECSEAMCATCKLAHRKFSVSKNHSVVDLTSLTADQLASHRPSPCPDHAEKPCELFCPSHEVSMCTVCATSRHRSCPDVIDLKQKAEESRVTLSRLAAELTAAERELDLAMEQLDQHVQETKNKTAAGLAEVKAVCDRLKSAIDARYQRVKEAVEGACSDVIKRVQAGKACLLQRRGNVTSRKPAVQRTIEAKGQHVVNGMASIMTSQVENLDCSSSIPDREKTMSLITIVIDPGVVTLIDQQLATIGQVEVVSTDSTPSLTSPAKVSSPQKPLTGATSVLTGPRQKEFRFHDNHGGDIQMSNNNQTAKSIGVLFEKTFVFGCLPMAVGDLYQVMVDETSGGGGGVFPVCVVTRHPHTVDVSHEGWYWPSSVVIWSNHVNIYGKRDRSIKIGSKLMNLAKKSRVGVLIDDRRSLHLYINEVDQGVVAPDMPHPCYPLFFLDGLYKQITALPVKHIR